ncbi:MAG: YidC/Oxa1 family membrane protein insertase [Candidatus Buchananbacteria bacterium]
MEIITYFWHYYLYIPLFNFLIFLYNNYSNYNLGIAVIILTVLLRLLLLPFSILTEQSKIVSDKLTKEVREIEKDFAADVVKKKQMIRLALKKRKVRPWAKAIVLGVQGLVLFLLYQVFLGGINTEEKLHQLYPSIMRPDFVNTKFLWFNVGQKDLLITFIVALYIFVDILIQRWGRSYKLSKKEQLFSLLFPAFCFLILYSLPSVKSLFILTSLVFSSIISMITIFIQITLKQAENKPQK